MLKTLKYWVDDSREFKDNDGSEPEGEIVFVEVGGNFYVFELDEDDGYRSHCDEWQNIPRTTILKWIEEKGLTEKKIHYDRLELNKAIGETHWDLRAFIGTTVVFAVGTDDSDDYYPSFEFDYAGNQDENNPSKR